jgi:hypothetical protein
VLPRVAALAESPRELGELRSARGGLTCSPASSRSSAPSRNGPTPASGSGPRPSSRT